MISAIGARTKIKQLIYVPFRWCKYNLFCGGAIVREEAFCYSPGDVCEEKYLLQKEDFPPMVDFFSEGFHPQNGPNRSPSTSSSAQLSVLGHRPHLEDLDRIFGRDSLISNLHHQGRIGGRRGTLFDSISSPPSLLSSREGFWNSHHQDLWDSELDFPLHSRLDSILSSRRGSKFDSARERKPEFHSTMDWSAPDMSSTSREDSEETTFENSEHGSDSFQGEQMSLNTNKDKNNLLGIVSVLFKPCLIKKYF